MNKFTEFINQESKELKAKQWKKEFYKKKQEQKPNRFKEMSYDEWRNYFHKKYNYINLGEKKLWQTKEL